MKILNFAPAENAIILAFSGVLVSFASLCAAAFDWHQPTYPPKAFAAVDEGGKIGCFDWADLPALIHKASKEATSKDPLGSSL
jgi:hypothetical protein